MDQQMLIAQKKASQNALNQAEAALLAAMREIYRIDNIDCTDEEQPDLMPLFERYWEAIDQCKELNMQYQCDQLIE